MIFGGKVKRHSLESRSAKMKLPHATTIMKRSKILNSGLDILPRNYCDAL